MTSWKDNLQPASYRGIEFLVSSATSAGGRRINVLNYPEKDFQEFEDVGKAEGTFSFSAYVMGEDYFDRREALIKACGERGSGVLVHPYRGTFRARCGSWSVTETESEGRIARFDLSFTEDRQIKISYTKYSTQTVFDRKATLLESIGAWLATAADYARKPVTALERTVETVDKVLDVVQQVKTITEAVPEYTRLLRQLQGRPEAILLNVEAMWQNMATLINFGTDFTQAAFHVNADNARQQRREMQTIADNMADPLVPNSGELGEAIQAAVILTAIAGEIGLLGVIDFYSPQEAIDAEQDLINRIDAILDAIDPSDDLYRDLTDTLTALHADLDARQSDLSELVDLELDGETDLLTLSNAYYGLVDVFDEIRLRNGIIHPMFLSTAEPVKLKVEP